MSAFAKGMEAGKRVRQGQVIGFVGSTGMSTGAHVTTKSWSMAASSIRCASSFRAADRSTGRMLASFEKERDRLDGMMNNRGSARAYRTPPARRRRGRSAIADVSR